MPGQRKRAKAIPQFTSELSNSEPITHADRRPAFSDFMPSEHATFCGTGLRECHLQLSLTMSAGAYSRGKVQPLNVLYRRSISIPIWGDH